MNPRLYRSAAAVLCLALCAIAGEPDIVAKCLKGYSTKVQGGANDWDVVQVEVEELLMGCEEGLFEPIDWQMLGGREQYLADIASEEQGE